MSALKLLNFEPPSFRTLILLCLLGTYGCKEELPTYTPPRDLFSVYLSSYDSAQVIFYSTTSKQPPVTLYRFFDLYGKFRIHVQNPDNPNVEHGSPIIKNFIFGVENLYNETIQTVPLIKGTFEIWPEGHPDKKYTAALDNNILNQSPLYSNGLITIDPHQKIYFTMPWNFTLNTSETYIHQFASTASEADAGEFWRMITFQPLMVNVRVSIQLYKQSTVYVSEQKIPISLYGRFYLGQ